MGSTLMSPGHSWSKAHTLRLNLAAGNARRWLGRWEWWLKEPGTRAACRDRLHAALQRAGMAAAARGKASALATHIHIWDVWGHRIAEKHLNISNRIKTFIMGIIRLFLTRRSNGVPWQVKRIQMN